MSEHEFDAFGAHYDEILDSSLAISGEGVDYFDSYKARCLSERVLRDRSGLSILDFGCGVGRLAALIAESHPDCTVHGVDISAEVIKIACTRFPAAGNLTFSTEVPPENSYDVISTANVFHHIPPPRRSETVIRLKRLLSDQGKLVIFEHNPWNPLTQYVVRTCPFDVNAKLIFSREFARMASRVGLQVELRRYIVFFPRILKMLRRFEPMLGSCPLGAQYMMVLGAGGTGS